MECPHIHIENVEVMWMTWRLCVCNVEVMWRLCGGYVDPHCEVSTCPNLHIGRVHIDFPVITL